MNCTESRTARRFQKGWTSHFTVLSRTNQSKADSVRLSREADRPEPFIQQTMKAQDSARSFELGRESQRTSQLSASPTRQEQQRADDGSRKGSGLRSRQAPSSSVPRRSFTETSDYDFDDQPREARRVRRGDGSSSIESVKRPSLSAQEALTCQIPKENLGDQFFKELSRSCLQQPRSVSQELLSGAGERFTTTADEANRQIRADFTAKHTRSRHRFSRVRPLHVCAAHSFVCFRNNGDLVAATPHSVLVYDRPPAACEISYKEPLYSIPIGGVSMAADLSHSRILVLRQGNFMASDERAADELLMAEVATGETQLMAKIALPQHSIVRHVAGDHLMIREKASRRDSAECRGMQVNQTEHKVYLLYDHHLLVMDLDMQLEPLAIRLRCKSDELGPAVALMEFDHAIYVLTARSHLLGCSKASLFSPSPGACCLPVLQRLDSRLAAREIRSCVVDRRQATAFFSVPRGCKLISLAFPVPFSDAEPAGTANFPVLQERIYATASCSDGATSVPCAMAWDATTEQLLVLEWGSENNGVLVTVDFSPDDGAGGGSGGGDRDRQKLLERPQQQQRTSERLPIVKTFGQQVLSPLARRLVSEGSMHTN